MNRMVMMGVVVVAAAVAAATGGAASGKAAPQTSRLERGKYLVSTLGCVDCHAPKKMGAEGPEIDESRYLAGHPEQPLPAPPKLPPGPWMVTSTWDATAWSGPWGVSYAMNLTPDENTGIGSWSEETFVQAIRTGRHMGVSRPILPPMPWQVYRNLSDEDLRSVYAYLRSLPPVHNRIPQPQIAEPPSASGGK